ncbi:MAG: UpxY family transcription antiterminator [Rikenellaceae bacterium]
MVDYSDKGVVWYAMRTTYQREMRAKALLDAAGVENFVPMRRCVTVVRGKKIVTLKPALHNLIFVKSDSATMREIKSRVTFMQSRLTEFEGTLFPIVVPTEQMEQFIYAVECAMDEITIVDLVSMEIEKGVSARIIDGKFKGFVGVLSKIKGTRDRRVTINVEGVVAYTIDVDASFIEKI